MRSAGCRRQAGIHPTVPSQRERIPFSIFSRGIPNTKYSKARKNILAAICALLLVGTFCTWAQAAAVCSQPGIQVLAPSDTTITSATAQINPAAYCDVFGYVTTQTDSTTNKVMFELGLPDAWNGGFELSGNGGFGGSLNTGQLPVTLLIPFGWATAVSDTGHESSSSGPELDGSFALNNPAARDDWLYRSSHVVTVASQAIIKGYLSQAPLSFFWGCSTGGRQGLVEAQQFPSDFNGIVSIAPPIGNWVAGFNWDSEHVTAGADSFIPPDKIALVDQTVLKSCDKTDGVRDGLIQDPRACNFDPQSLQCKGADSSTCLTAAQVATLKAVYQGAKKSYPGYTQSDPGSDSTDNGWADWITGLTAPDALGTAEPWSSLHNAPGQFLFQDQFLKFLVFNDPKYNSLTFDLTDLTQLAKLQAVVMRGGADASNPDLSAFRNNGGKLLIF